MSERGNELRVGVMLTVAGFILIFGIFWLGGFQFGEDRYRFSVVFPEVAGLSAGDRVTVAGLTAGQVDGLTLSGGRVVVDVAVDRSIRIPVDSKISVASYGLIGAKTIAVRPGTSRVYVEPGATVFGSYEKGLGDVVAEMGEALTEIRQVLRSADEIISDTEARQNMKQTLDNASVASGDLREAVADFRATAAELRAFVEKNKEGVAVAVDSLTVASSRFAEFTSELHTVSSTLDTILSRIERGEGSLGKIIGEDEAHDEFVAAVREVRDLVAEIRRNPKSFVRFSIF